MRQSLIAMTVWIGLSAGSAIYPQLGPKDRVDLKPTDLERVKVGDKAPDFTLENMDEKRVALSDFRGKENVVLVFYRGHW